MLLGIRLRWKLACVVAVMSAFFALSGFAFALVRHIGIEQTRHVTVACVETRPTLWQTFRQGGRAVCVGKPLRHRGLARRVAVVRAPSHLPSYPPTPAGSIERAEVAPRVPADPGGLTPPADNTSPDTSITSGPPATTAATTAKFAFSSSESGSTFECKRDGGAWQTCISPKGYSSLAAGAHVLLVRATDAAGNVDPTPASWNWTVEGSTPPVDNTPPQTSIASGPSGTTTSTTASFVLASNESGSSFECKLDEDEWSTCGTKTTYTELEIGSDPGARLTMRTQPRHPQLGNRRTAGTSAHHSAGRMLHHREQHQRGADGGLRRRGRGRGLPRRWLLR